MKGKIKRVLEIFAFVAIMIAMFLMTSFVLNRQLTPNEIRVKNFYKEPKNSLDMVVIGSSSVYTTFSSPLAWKEQGFTSYVLATSGAPMGIMKSMVQEVVRTQNPKLIVIDMNGAQYKDKTENKEGSLRFWIDNMPMSKNKIQTIQELVPEGERSTYYIPLKKYHNNWEKLKSCVHMSLIDLRAQNTKENLSISGFSSTSRMVKRNPNKIIDVSDMNERQALYASAKEHLEDLLTYLQENHLNNVVFVNMPRFYEKKMLASKRLTNEAARIIREKGFKVYDFDNDVEAMGLDMNHDYYDVVHTNIYGQAKVTSYMSQLFNAEYKLKSNHEEAIVKKWNREYESYQKVYTYLDKEITAGRSKSYDVRNFEELLEW